mgnify:CR=1 FL=1
MSGDDNKYRLEHSFLVNAGVARLSIEIGEMRLQTHSQRPFTQFSKLDEVWKLMLNHGE